MLGVWAEEAPASARKLDLKDRGLTEVPIDRLRGYAAVDLSGNNLTELPPRLGELTELRGLDASGNALRAIPREIRFLHRLVELDVSYNQLTELPEEIGQLRALRELRVHENRIAALPDLGACRRLEYLDIDGNRIRELGRWLGNLTLLRTFYAARNELVALPPEIGRLQRLSTLMLVGNELAALPRELADLPPTVFLGLDSNPLGEPLNSLVDAETEQIFAYLRSLGDATRLYEGKLLLVGEGDVGKSSLRDALRDDPFVEGRSTTHGIELRDLRLPHPDEPGVTITLNMWDFGGQPVYRISHQFFFSRRALYLVVWKPREGVDENAVAPWCRRILLRVGAEATILVVATHARERTPQLDYASLELQFGNAMAGKFAVDSSDGMNIDALREAIAEHAARLPQMGEPLSASWVAARDAILGRPEPVIPYLEFAAECDHHGLDAIATSALVHLLAELGKVVHYDDEGLRDIVVLKPEWLTKAISFVLEDEETLKAGGVLEHRRLAQIWGQPTEGEGYAAEYHPYFLRLMEKFDLSYRLEDEDASLVGQMVPYERPTVAWSQPDATRELSLICELAEPVDGLMAWFTVRHHRFGVGRHWRRGVFLAHATYGTEALFEQLDDAGAQFRLTVRGPSPDSFFSILRDGLEYLIAKRWAKLDYDMLVPCRGTRPDGRPCTFHFKFRHLLTYREEARSTIDCHECLSQQDVGELLTGFPAPKLQDSLARIERRIEDVAVVTRNIDATTAELMEIASDTAGHVRLLLKAATAEVDDCPCLFTLERQRPGLLARAFKSHDGFRLTLWCEHPDHEHPWSDATYRFTQPKAWLVSIGPYASVVVRTLQLVVPIAGAAAGVVLPERDAKALKEEIELTKELVKALPDIDVGDGAGLEGDGLTRAQGAGLRALRAVILEHDPRRHYGGLSRYVAPSGDFVFVCPEHSPAYDPGLPALPVAAAG